jgi:hypothetical protein
MDRVQYCKGGEEMKTEWTDYLKNAVVQGMIEGIEKEKKLSEQDRKLIEAVVLSTFEVIEKAESMAGEGNE